MTLSYDGAFGSGSSGSNGGQMHAMGGGAGSGDGWPTGGAIEATEAAVAAERSGASPLQAAIDASNWTRADVELAVEIGSTLAVLILAWVALQEGGR